MIVSRTPLRISFVGGGSDLPTFYRGAPDGGAVVSTAIDKYVYIAINAKFDGRVRASYSITENVDTADQLQHELIREALHLVGIDRGVEITSVSDVPSHGSGLGSSSSYVVGLLAALYMFKGQSLDAERIARDACHIEIERCKKPIGKQDQYIATVGGLQYIQFHQDDTVTNKPIYYLTKRTTCMLERHLLLFYTGLARASDDILAEQQYNAGHSNETRQYLGQMVDLARQLYTDLSNDNLSTFGDILHQGWQLKKQLAHAVSNPKIDQWYTTARQHGAIGGKLLGAGGGGFLLLYAPPEKHQAIIQILQLKVVPISFEPKGVQIFKL